MIFWIPHFFMEQHYVSVVGAVSTFKSRPTRAGAEKHGQQGSYSVRKMIKCDRNGSKWIKISLPSCSTDFEPRVQDFRCIHPRPMDFERPM